MVRVKDVRKLNTSYPKFSRIHHVIRTKKYLIKNRGLHQKFRDVFKVRGISAALKIVRFEALCRSACSISKIRSSNQCPICFESVPNDPIHWMCQSECRHRMHLLCALKYMNSLNGTAHPSCPLCRAPELYKYDRHLNRELPSYIVSLNNQHIPGVFENMQQCFPNIYFG